MTASTIFPPHRVTIVGVLNVTPDSFSDGGRFVRDDTPLDESVAVPGEGFLATLCADWEAEARKAEERCRVVLLRIGVVCDRAGGAVQQMELPFKLFAGGRVADGQQWFSWIHLDDMVGIYLRAIDDDTLRGPVNAVAPGAVRQGAFAKALGKALRRPAWMPVPKFALKAAAGQLSEYLVNGRHAIPKALTDAGYEFRYPDVDGALAAIYDR